MIDNILKQHMPYKVQPSRKSLIGFAVLLYIAILSVVLMVVVSLSVLVGVSGSSMTNNYHDGDLVLINKFLKNPKIGDVVVLSMAGDGVVFEHDEDIIKRVIAAAGDTIEFKLNEKEYKDDTGLEHAIVDLYRGKDKDNLELVTENYIREPMFLEKFNFSYSTSVKIDQPIIIPDGEIFVMGDNRNDSTDSRIIGSIPKAALRGVMYLRFEKGTFGEWLFRLIYGFW